MEMYNRYIRNDQGVYQRIPTPEPGPGPAPPPRQAQPRDERSSPGRPVQTPRPTPTGGLGNLLSGLLGKLHLDHIDTGDLLLLAILFLLFQEDGDEELLMALGLLLIL